MDIILIDKIYNIGPTKYRKAPESTGTHRKAPGSTGKHRKEPKRTEKHRDHRSEIIDQLIYWCLLELESEQK